jgi:hypothetical protein
MVKGNAHGSLVGKPDGKTKFERPKHRLDEHIQMDIKAIGQDDVDRIHLAWDRDNWWAVVHKVMNFRFP